jgi:hypothetical protein
MTRWARRAPIPSCRTRCILQLMVRFASIPPTLSSNQPRKQLIPLIYHCGAMDGDGKPIISPISESMYVDLRDSGLRADKHLLSLKGFLEPQNIDILFHQGLYITPRPKMPSPATSQMPLIAFYLDISPAPRSTSRTIRQPLNGFSGSNPI